MLRWTNVRLITSWAAEFLKRRNLREACMSEKWNQTSIQKYIDDEVQESLTLDYKAADSLGKGDGKKREITKDASAMANSAGGIIIYGVAEYQAQDKKHLPEKIDPVDQTRFPKEWLEQVINNIRPRIDGVVITPVPIDTDPNDVVYVVEIPQSTTAHQAADWRYYKRFNFMSVPMEDYEIRDVMNRSTKPDIQVTFAGKRLSHGQTSDPFALEIVIRNMGRLVVNHFKLEFTFPDLDVLPLSSHSVVEPTGFTSEEGPDDDLVVINVTDARKVAVERREDSIRVVYRSIDVLFPNDQEDVSRAIELGYLMNNYVFRRRREIPPLKWTLYADDMIPKQGEVPFSQLCRDF